MSYASSDVVGGILHRLDGVKKSESGWVARCPAHEDKRASLSVGKGRDGRTLLHCFAGCETADIVARLGLEMSDLAPSDVRERGLRRAERPPEKRKRVKVWPDAFSAAKAAAGASGAVASEWSYYRQDGALCCLIYRIDDGAGGKTYRPVMPVEGGYALGRPDAPLPLYRLRHVAGSGAPVVVVEGEKCADRMAALGYWATTSMGGSSSAAKSDWSPVKGRDVIIFPDNDRPGRKYANDVMRLCWAEGAARIKIVDLGGGKGDDVVDFLGAHEPSEIRARVDEVPWIEATGGEVPDRHELSDSGNAGRLIEAHGQDLRSVPGWGWMAWTGVLWERDQSEAHRRAHATVRAIYKEADAAEDSAEAKRIARHALQSGAAYRFDAMIRIASHHPTVVAKTTDFDADAMLFNCGNGSVDLRTGKLRKHRRKDYQTKLCGTDYDAGAKAPNWDRFIATVTDGRENLAGFLRRAVGYSLTGVIRDRRCLFLCYGSGANGKSRFLAALRSMLGGYGQQAPTSLLAERRGDSVPNDLARLVGVRFVTVSEARKGLKGAGEVVKTLGGSESVAARFLRREFFEFQPCAKIWWGVNDRPAFRDDDAALWDRILEVPFLKTIPREERIPEDKLDAMLRSELPGILAWAVRGCLEWQAEGLSPPNCVTRATEEYRRNGNPLLDFVEEECVQDPGVSATIDEIWKAYLCWCEANRVRITFSKRSLAQRLTGLGVERFKSSGVRKLKGIRLLDITERQRDV